MARFCAPLSPEISEREKKNLAASRRIAAEGTVKCSLTMEELRRCAGRILRIIAKSNAYENSVPY